MNLSAVKLRRSPFHQPVGNLYCDRLFAERLLRQLLMNGSRLQASLNVLEMEDQFAGNRLVHLLPIHAKSMFGVAEDAWSSPDLVQWRHAFNEQMKRRHELQVTGDGTMKVCFALKGQMRRKDGGGSVPAERGGGAWSAEKTNTVV